MVKLIGIVLICLALASPAYAYRVDNVIINNTDGTRPIQIGVPPSVTADTVGLGTTARALGNSTSIYSVQVTVPESNAGEVYIGDSSVATTAGYLVTVTGPDVKINVDNLADVYAVGTQGDVIHFIAETR